MFGAASKRAVAALLALLLAVGASAEAPGVGASCPEGVSERVQARYEGVRDLRARFVQRSTSVALGGDSPLESAPSEGEVWFEKPGRMRWSYQAPEPSLVVSDGEKLWIYDPGAGEVQVLSVGEGFLSGAAIQFLLGAGRLEESFVVEGRGCEEGRARLELRPRAEASYERIDLLVSAVSGEILETTVQDLFGNRTHVRFLEVAVNTEPDPSLFRFEPPDGVRVLSLPAPESP